jgi:hypothetical protein
VNKDATMTRLNGSFWKWIAVSVLALAALAPRAGASQVLFTMTMSDLTALINTTTGFAGNDCNSGSNHLSQCAVYDIRLTAYTGANGTGSTVSWNSEANSTWVFNVLLPTGTSTGGWSESHSSSVEEIGPDVEFSGGVDPYITLLTTNAAGAGGTFGGAGTTFNGITYSGAAETATASIPMSDYIEIDNTGTAAVSNIGSWKVEVKSVKLNADGTETSSVKTAVTDMYVNAAPEPASAALFFGGLAIVLGLRRKQRRTRVPRGN